MHLIQSVDRCRVTTALDASATRVRLLESISRTRLGDHVRAKGASGAAPAEAGDLLDNSFLDIRRHLSS
jgi:hypothetical protein